MKKNINNYEPISTVIKKHHSLYVALKHFGCILLCS